jgi:hypothetical protein
MPVMLQTHLEKIKIIHNKDLKDGFGSVYLPYALNKKYPNADKIFNWQYVFPSRKNHSLPNDDTASCPPCLSTCL